MTELTLDRKLEFLRYAKEKLEGYLGQEETADIDDIALCIIFQNWYGGGIYYNVMKIFPEFNEEVKKIQIRTKSTYYIQWKKESYNVKGRIKILQRVAKRLI